MSKDILSALNHLLYEMDPPILYNEAAFCRARIRTELYNVGTGRFCFTQFLRDLNMERRNAIRFNEAYQEELAIERLLL